MTGRHDRTRPVSRSGAAGYLKKAGEFLESMRQAQQAGRWNAAGLNAVHCAISSCDAVLVYYTQERSAGSNHEAAVHLLASLAKVPEARQKADTLRKILHRKHMVEYEDRAVTTQEAAELAKLAERLHQWAAKLLEP